MKLGISSLGNIMENAFKNKFPNISSMLYHSTENVLNLRKNMGFML